MKIILSAMFIFICTGSRAQINIINQSLTDSSQNIFYIGVDNHIKLKAGKDIPYYQLVIKGTTGSITKIDETEYIVRVSKIDTCKLIVSKKGKQVFIKSYMSALIPDHFVGLNGLYNTTISKSKILINPFLKVVVPGSYYRHNYRVLSFCAAFIQGADSTSIYTNGYELNPEQLKLTRQLKPGDSIYFSEIRVNYECGRITTTPPFWIKIE